MTWASAIIERGRAVGPIPRYESPEWAALSPSDPRFVAAVAVAAECWDEGGRPETIRRTVELEVTANTQLERAQEARDFADLAAGVRALSSVPEQAELARRRGYVVAA